MHLGRDVLLNFAFVFLDICEFGIGDGTQVRPQVPSPITRATG